MCEAFRISRQLYVRDLILGVHREQAGRRSGILALVGVVTRNVIRDADDGVTARWQITPQKVQVVVLTSSQH